jgi:phage tail sheath protein FI
MPIFLSPGVKTRELDFSTYVGQVSTCIVGMVGAAIKGPVGIPTLCTSPNDFIRIFGEPLDDDYGAIAALLFLLKGNQLWYVRETKGTESNAVATFDGQGPGVPQKETNTVVCPGAGIAQEESVTVVGTATGSGDITVTVTADGIVEQDVVVGIADEDTATAVADKIKTALALNGVVNGFFTIGGVSPIVKLTAKTKAANDSTMNIAIDGNSLGITNVTTSTHTTTGLAPNTVTANGNLSVVVAAFGMTGSAITLTVPVLKGDTATVVSGKIQTAMGNNININGFFLISGTGADVVLEAKAIAANDTSMNIAISSNSLGITEDLTSENTVIGSAGSVVSEVLTITFKEKGTYGNRYSAKVTAISGLSFTLAIYDGTILKESFVASLDENNVKYIGNVVSDTFEYVVDLGATESMPTSDLTPLEDGTDGTPLSAANVIGTGVRGLNAFANPNMIDINVLAAPGRFEASVVSALIAISESRADCFAIIDPPAGLSATDVVKYHNGELTGTDYPTTSLDSSYAATYYPWVKVTNPATATDMWCPPSAVVLGAFAVNDDIASPWFAPAGLTRGNLNLVLDSEMDFSEGELDLLYGNDNAINPIINFRRQGFVIWGQRTLQRTDSALDRINVRRMMLYVRKLVSISSAYVVFEQNDSRTWDRWKAMVTPFLEGIKSARGLYDYKVIMDNTTITPLNIDRNEMSGQILLKPTKTAEFVLIDFVLKSTGAAF